MKENLKKVTDQIKKDNQLREAWKANLAMAYKDNYHWYQKETGKKVLNSEDRHIVANKAADYFLDLLCS